MDDERSIQKVCDQTNCTSLPDSLNNINFDICKNPVSKQYYEQSKNKVVNNLYFKQINQIPSIVINSNEVEPETLALGVIPRRSSNMAKRATSLLVRFSNEDKVLSKQGKTRMKILAKKLRIEDGHGGIEVVDTRNADADTITAIMQKVATTAILPKKRDEADSGLCSANEETNIVISDQQSLQMETPFKEFKVNEKQQLIRSLTKPFSNIRRQANK